jgi:outer membrane protein insertion porin family
MEHKMMMYQKTCRTICSALWLALGLLPAFLQAQTVRSLAVEQQGVGRIDRDFVLAHTQIAVGDVFHANIAARDVRRLLDTGRFTTADVSIVAQTGDELDVLIRVTPRMRLVVRPEIEGVDAFSMRRVRKWLDLKEGALLDDQVAATALRRVLDEYRKRHYREATGTWSFKVQDPNRGTVSVVFSLEEGTRSIVNRIKLEGNETFRRSAMREPLKAPHPLNPWRWFVAKRFEPRELDEIRAGLRNFYLDQGYLDVEVAMETGKARRRRYARYQITEGPLYKVGDVKVEGVTLFDSASVEGIVLSLTGTHASLGGLDAAADRLQAFYGIEAMWIRVFVQS